MTRSLPRLAGVVVTLVSLAVSSVHAQEAPTDDVRERARASYREGQRQFNIAKYEEAADAFEQAFKLIPNPVVLLSLSESRAKAGQMTKAIDALRKYLELRPDAPDRAAVEGRIKLMSAKPALLAMTSDPSDADVEVDGSPMFRTPVQLQLAPGGHEIRCTRPGYRAHSESVNLQPGSRQSLNCTLEVLPPQPRVSPLDSELGPAVTASSSASSSGRPMTAIWISGGIGTAALVGSTVFGFLAVKENRDFKAHPTKAGADRGERYGLIADVGFGVGVVGIATAVTLYLLGEDSSTCVNAAANGGPVLHF